ncbi:hypothetical protein GCM10017717_12710 [Deinococcus persicinus]
MQNYLVYALLLFMISIAILNSWGNSSKTVWYVIAFISIICLLILKTIEQKNTK